MKDNINLIHNRAENPPTGLEKLSFSIPFTMFFAYALSLGLAVLIIQSFNREYQLIDNHIQRLHELEAEAAFTGGDTELIEDQVQSLELIVRILEDRWLWQEKINMLQTHLPDSVYLTSVTGQAGLRLQISGYADHSRALGTQKVREMIGGLRSDPEFSRLFSDIHWQRSRATDAHPNFETVLEFELSCQAREN